MTKTNPITFAIRAKGPIRLLRRAFSIVRHYGLTPHKMERALDQFSRILSQFDCSASFALTAVVLARHPHVIRPYLERNIEFVVHGYTHTDYSQLPPEAQMSHLQRARQSFVTAGVPVTGFRSPYLRRESHLYAAIQALGFLYTSNQTISWDVLDLTAFKSADRASYMRALRFYEPWLAVARPALPRLHNHLVEIPVALPDDEMLVDRLQSAPDHLVQHAWGQILAETYRLGELFTVQLHPERIASCADGLVAILTEARRQTPPVWLAQLGEIASWWRARTAAAVHVQRQDSQTWRLQVDGPPGTTFLVRGVETVAPAEPWTAGYRSLPGPLCTVQATRCPFIGVSPHSSSELISFLRQQGYILKTDNDAQHCTVYLDRPDFSPLDERLILSQIEESDGPLVRLGRWPYGARSAMAITGDIDALTIWGYTRRLFGR